MMLLTAFFEVRFMCVGHTNVLIVACKTERNLDTAGIPLTTDRAAANHSVHTSPRHCCGYQTVYERAPRRLVWLDA
jgi:hypothetical protein